MNTGSGDQTQGPPAVTPNGSLRIDKVLVVDFLRSRGHHDRADYADQRLPEVIETKRDYRLLGRLGIRPSELLASFGYPDRSDG